ncbi:MAG: Rieske (2Fe-2S) protein [Planctomycetota bacterium]
MPEEAADDAADYTPADYTTVARVGEINEGEGATYQVGQRLVAVFLQNGQYHAIDDLCPHMGASLGAGALDEDGGVMCPWHAWRFSIKDGAWLDNPTLKIDTFEVRVFDEQIQVAVPAQPPTDPAVETPSKDEPPADESSPG